MTDTKQQQTSTQPTGKPGDLKPAPVTVATFGVQTAESKVRAQKAKKDAAKAARKITRNGGDYRGGLTATNKTKAGGDKKRVKKDSLNTNKATALEVNTTRRRVGKKDPSEYGSKRIKIENRVVKFTDPNDVELLYRLGLTNQDVADLFDLSVDYVEGVMTDSHPGYIQELSQAARRGRALLRTDLRSAQRKNALKMNNAKMQIHLGINELGQVRNASEVRHTGEVKHSIRSEDMVVSMEKARAERRALLAEKYDTGNVLEAVIDDESDDESC